MCVSGLFTVKKITSNVTSKFYFKQERNIFYAIHNLLNSYVNVVNFQDIFTSLRE